MRAIWHLHKNLQPQTLASTRPGRNPCTSSKKFSRIKELKLKHACLTKLYSDLTQAIAEQRNVFCEKKLH